MQVYNILETVRHSIDKAEEMYKKGVELASKDNDFQHASVYSNYAVYLRVTSFSYRCWF